MFNEVRAPMQLAKAMQGSDRLPEPRLPATQPVEQVRDGLSPAMSSRAPSVVNLQRYSRHSRLGFSPGKPTLVAAFDAFGSKSQLLNSFMTSMELHRADLRTWIRSTAFDQRPLGRGTFQLAWPSHVHFSCANCLQVL